MRIVLDTNVLISGLIRPHSFPATILRLVLNGAVQLLVDERILQEYEEVASRPKFGIRRSDLDQILDQIREQGERVVAEPLGISLPDRDDLPFLEVAWSGKADAIVTGNKRHFPNVEGGAPVVLSPTEVLEKLARR